MLVQNVASQPLLWSAVQQTIECCLVITWPQAEEIAAVKEEAERDLAEGEAGAVQAASERLTGPCAAACSLNCTDAAASAGNIDTDALYWLAHHYRTIFAPQPSRRWTLPCLPSTPSRPRCVPADRSGLCRFESLQVEEQLRLMAGHSMHGTNNSS